MRAGTGAIRTVVYRGGPLTYDDLFSKDEGGWFEHVTPECRRFLEGLAADVAERGKNPVWARVLRRVAEDFPEDAPKTIIPIQRAVRELVDG